MKNLLEFSIAVTEREIDIQTCFKDELTSVLKEYYVGTRKTNGDRFNPISYGIKRKGGYSAGARPCLKTCNIHVYFYMFMVLKVKQKRLLLARIRQLSGFHPKTH
jgi:hypothetical protein